MWLVVGLGNPGTQYSLTRHNIGFLAIDHWLNRLNESRSQQQFKAEINKLKLKDTQIITCKPQTFMNLSGESVQPLLDFYKIEKSNLIVIQDEIDQEFTKIKIQQNRGHGGHNGIRSISERLGSSDYIRLRLGVGRPLNPNIPIADYVLGKFSNEEMNQLPDFLNRSCDAIEAIIFSGVQKASTQFNK